MKKIIIASSVVLAVVLAGTGAWAVTQGSNAAPAAVATTAAPAATPPATGRPCVRALAGRGTKTPAEKTARLACARRLVLRRSAKVLDIKAATLRADVLSGHSLASVAATKGYSEPAFVAAIVAPADARINKAVAAHKITAARGTLRKARLDRVVTRMVNASK